MPAVDEADRKLAIVLSDEAPAPGQAADAGEPQPTLELLEDLFDRIAQRPLDDLPQTLARLVEAIGGDGAYLARLENGHEPVVTAAWGDLAAAPHERLLLSLAAEARRDGGSGQTWASLRREGPPALHAAFRLGPGDTALALVVWGDPARLRDVPAALRLLVRLIDRLHTRIPLPPAPSRQEAPFLSIPSGFFVGRSASMRRLYDEMRSLVEGDLPVLLTGETGVGKEHLARTLHDSSSRLQRPFVAINCAAIPAELLEAELFGIGRGVATGVSERVGKFEQAAGGTILLDEIGEMPIGLQAKLLRALEEREVVPVGGRPLRLEARVLAATNLPLRQRAEQGQFRRDLYYRLAGYVLRVPPLRERREDIPALIEHFLEATAREARKRIRGLTVRALRAMVDCAWPGNVRELRHEVNRLVYLCPEGGVIDSDLLSDHVLEAAAPAERSATTGDLELATHVAQVERRIVALALARSRGNRSRAARLLGLSRNGLAAKIKKLGLEE